MYYLLLEIKKKMEQSYNQDSKFWEKMAVSSDIFPRRYKEIKDSFSNA